MTNTPTHPTPHPQAQPPADRPGWFQRWLEHHERMAALKAARRQRPTQVQALPKKPINPQGLRHAIQRSGHNVLPLLFLLAAFGSTLLFFLGNQYSDRPPYIVVIPVIVVIALCIEWALATLSQDLQDAITLHDTAGIIRSALFCTVTYGASVFMLANASAQIWAPRDVLLGITPNVWAWLMAAFFFGVQLALKLTPERPRGARNLAMIAGFITLAYPEASPEEQAQIAARMLTVIGTKESLPVLPEARTNHHQPLPGPLVPLVIEGGEDSDASDSFR